MKQKKLILMKLFRSSRPNAFHRIAILQSFAKFTWKHLPWSAFLSKVAVKPYKFALKRLHSSYFTVNFQIFVLLFFKRTSLDDASVIGTVTEYSHSVVNQLTNSKFTIEKPMSHVTMSLSHTTLGHCVTYLL